MQLTGNTAGSITTTISLQAGPRRAAAAVLVVQPDPDADAGFVGRAGELAQLLAVLAPRTLSRDVLVSVGAVPVVGTVVVSAVGGAPGVGKTALAWAAARAAAVRGWFAGGVVFVDLHGYDPDPADQVWPAQLYAGLLRGMGVPPNQLPVTADEQATAYHQVLAHLAGIDRAVLVVLDNVADPAQVLPLLPVGTSTHRVLITSRDTLGELPGARLVELTVLAPAAAVELLELGLQRRRPGDGQVVADSASAGRLVELCGRLPLAVQIVAALAADEPDRPLAELADELADERGRLRALDYGPRWAVRAAFDLSHRRLDPALKRLFRLLAAVPGPDVSLSVAAVVADQPELEVRARLRALCRAHLLEQQPSQPGQPARWRMHDLIRLYAWEHLAEDERTVGFTRVLTYYRHTADLAERRFTALPAHDVPAGFDTPQQALAWVLGERAGLVAAVVQAAEIHPDEAIGLSADLVPILDRARLLADWVTAATAAVQASRHTPRRDLAATAWNSLGNALQGVRRFEEAISAHEQARDISREVGNRHGEGTAGNNLGIAHEECAQPDRAHRAWVQAVMSSSRWGTTRGQPWSGSGWPIWTGRHRPGPSARIRDNPLYHVPSVSRTRCITYPAAAAGACVRRGADCVIHQVSRKSHSLPSTHRRALSFPFTKPQPQSSQGPMFSVP